MDSTTSINTTVKENFADLVYFGYIYEDDSHLLQKEFIEEVTKEFPEIRLKDSYDDIKGYRQSVYISEDKEEDYLVWAFCHGWLNCSMTLTMKAMNDKEFMAKIFEKGKIKYPECFKPEAFQNNE